MAKITGAVYQAGFSLIELLVVVVLIGILTISVLPRFVGTSTFTEYALQDEIISAARFAQQRAMTDHRAAACYRLTIGATQFGPQRSTDSGASFLYFGPHATNGGNDSSQVIDGSVTVTTTSVFFDGLGNALDGCSGNSAAFTVTITGEETLQVRVETTGYTHAL